MAHVHRSLILLLGALTAFGPLTIDMYLPSLPTLEQSFDVSAAAVQMTVAAFFIGLAIGQAFYGPISDAYGRKIPLIVGLVIYVAASIGCALANDVSTMIGLRFVQAIGSSAGMVIARAVVRDYVIGQEAARIFSALMLVMGVAPVLAPLLGGYVLVWFGWRAIFIALAIFGLACLAASSTVLPETLPSSARRRSGVVGAIMTYARLSRDRRFMGFALSGGFAIEAKAVGVGCKTEKARVERELCAGGVSFAGERGNQPGALNDEVGLRKGDLRRTAVGKKFETANFIDDAFACGGAQLLAKMAGDDERPGGGIEARLGFKNANFSTAAHESGGGEQPGGGATDNNHGTFVRKRAGTLVRLCHCLFAPTTR